MGEMHLALSMFAIPYRTIDWTRLDLTMCTALITHCSHVVLATWFTVPYHTILHYSILIVVGLIVYVSYDQHSSTLHYTLLHFPSLHYTTLYYTTLHYTTLHYTTLHYTALHSITYATLYISCTQFFMLKIL